VQRADIEIPDRLQSKSVYEQLPAGRN
jgi:hypothetical protein